MEITDLLFHENYTIAFLKGYPGQLAWQNGTIKREDYAIVIKKISNSVAIIKVDPTKDREKLIKLAQIKSDKSFRGCKLYLKDPIAISEYMCISQEDRKSVFPYCWFVEDMKWERLPNIKGIDPEYQYIKYLISCKTRPDVQSIDLTARIGITRYYYRHHGTISEVDLKLVEFHKGKE